MTHQVRSVSVGVGLYIVLVVAVCLFRYWRLAEPGQMYFDEFAHAGGGEAILMNNPVRDWGVHPPLSHSLMAASMKLFDRVQAVKMSVPFVPQDAAFLAANQSLYLLSPRGEAVVAISCQPPFRQRWSTLSRSCQKLYSNYSRSPLLYGLAKDGKHLLQFDNEGHLLRTLPLPFAPDQVSVSEQHAHELLVAHLPSGRVALLNGLHGAVSWQKTLPLPLSDVVLGGQQGIIYGVSPKARSVIALNVNGDIFWQRRVEGTPQRVYPLWAPDVVRSGYAPTQHLLYVSDAAGDRIHCINPSVRRSPVLLRFHAPIQSLAWYGYTPYLYVLSAHKVYMLNVLTRQVTRVIPSPRYVDSLYLCAGGLGLMGVSTSRPEVVYWQVSNRAFAFRLPSALLGGILLPLLCFAFVWLGARNFTAALTGSLLVACDPLLFLLSRMGQIDAYVACFTVGTYFFCYHYLCTRSETRKVWVGSLMGVCIGLAIASKWNAVTACLGAMLLVLLAQRGVLNAAHAVSSPPRVTPRSHLGSWGFRCANFFVLPLLVYFASYAPAYAQGMSLGDVLRLQAQMFHFHAILPHDHELASRWWQWLFGMKSGLLFHDDAGSDGKWIYLCGAPWLWLLGLVCIVITAIRAWRTRDLFPTLIVIAFACAWLPWMFSPRTSFLYHFAPALPFLYMTVAYVISNVRNGTWQVSARWREYALLLCDGYVVLAVLTLVWLYPTLTGYPLPSQTGHHYSAWWMGWLPALAPP